jgi:hypothetical protein
MTTIATSWGNFRVATGRPCDAVVVMQSAFDRFSSDTLTLPVLSQTLSMIGHCQNSTGGSATGMMPWRFAEESRQLASVRLMFDTLKRFAPNPASVRPIKKVVLKELTTALERYKPGEVRVAEAAKVINSNDALFAQLNNVVSGYAVPLCGSSVQVPQRNVESIQRSLQSLRLSASTCS